MITYVNSVLVSNEATDLTAIKNNDDFATVKPGQIVYQILDEDESHQELATAQKIRIGLVTNKSNVLRKKDEKGNLTAEKRYIIRWSNAIQKADVKSLKYTTAPVDEITDDTKDQVDSEDEVTIDLSGAASYPVADLLKQGGKRVIVRITYKDLPTRYRKWTESYEYVTMEDDSLENIAAGIASQINGQWKRARVEAKPDGAKVVLKAMPYDDDDDFDTINRAGKVRFNVNMYFTDPAAEGWESLNKHYIQGATIDKKPGKQYPAIGKLVRDRENQSYGYMGILNRGMCTWPIIQPERIAQDNKAYDAVTLEFENMYRAADDIFRKTKQTVEIYTPKGGAASIAADLQAFTMPKVEAVDESEIAAPKKEEAAAPAAPATGE